MSEKILLQDILPLDDLLKNGKVLLVRHTDKCLKEMLQEGLLDEFQSFQSKSAFANCKYLVSFIGGRRNSAILYGVLQVTGLLLKDNLPKYSNELVNYCVKQDAEKTFI